MTDCIKRAGTYWTTCDCNNCHILRRRRRKLHYVGHQWRIPQHVAWDILADKFNAGWTARAVGSATKLDPPNQTNGRLYFSRHLTAWKRGDEILIGPTVANAIVNMSRPSEGQVGAEPYRRRLRALAAIGHGLDSLATDTGIAFSTLAMIRNENERVGARFAQAIADIYTRLHMTPGDDTQAQRIAREKGWPAPMAWNDIDTDPAPRGVQRDRWDETSIDEAIVERVLAGDKRPRKLTSAEAAEIVVRSLARGMTGGQIETLYGLKPDRYVKAGKRVA